MAAAKHMGKILIKIREENKSLNTPIFTELFYTCIPHKSYIILGVLRNVQNIMITLRNDANGYYSMRIKIWESYGVNIKILVGLNPTNRESCEYMLKTAIGNVKLMVYSILRMANYIMKRICEKIVKEGLPRLVIQWGAIEDVGLVADIQNDDKELTIEKSVVSSMVVPVKRARNVTNNIVDAVLNIMEYHPTLVEMDSIMAVEIKKTLGREYEIYLTMQYIRNLNFVELVEMNYKLIDYDNSDDDRKEKILGSRKILMRLVRGYLSIIIISLKTNSEKDNLLPGIEGYGNLFKILESKIKSLAICFQLAAKCELKTIQEMVNSFVSLLAIELTRKLKAKGFNSRLILIVGAPQHLKILIQQQLHSSSQEFESNILLATLDAFTSINSAELEFELRK
ncbi:hypothetical protein HZH68_003947 [Vespula germanica]|uniref:Uncharacterized protein n=1 Tax=Vespula germanica TaxID=30212 RepID=A0A834KMP8_VESGE|nr:hypothetical protein HZH68_003947 [Vespula germanica]